MEPKEVEVLLLSVTEKAPSEVWIPLVLPLAVHDQNRSPQGGLGWDIGLMCLILIDRQGRHEASMYWSPWQ